VSAEFATFVDAAVSICGCFVDSADSVGGIDAAMKSRSVGVFVVLGGFMGICLRGVFFDRMNRMDRMGLGWRIQESGDGSWWMCLKGGA